jgi:hypothetical protein
MYWYKIKSCKLITCLGGTLLMFFSIGCKPDVSENGSVQKYFDIKGYFDSEAVRLTKQNKPVLKTVTKDKSTETKNIIIKDWADELDLFRSADINKPAWKDSYSADTSGGLMVYKAKDPNLKVWEIIVNKQGAKVKWILIFNRTINKLYRTREKLSYFPDSLYLIQKTQVVKVLGKSNYAVKGIFNR